MHDVLNRNLFLVKEHVGMFKAANNFDVYDPDTGEVVSFQTGWDYARVSV